MSLRDSNHLTTHCQQLRAYRTYEELLNGLPHQLQDSDALIQIADTLLHLPETFPASYLKVYDLTDGWHHELTENRRSDPGIFDFLRWLRVDEPREQSLPPHQDQRAGQPSPGPAGSCDDRDTGTGPTTTNMPQTMRVWPGLKLIGVGGRVTKGIYVHVAEVGPEKIVLDGGDSFTHAALLKHTRLCHAITYASCQGLTLEGRVFLCDTESPHFTLKHLYVGSSRATSSELLSVL